MYIQIYTYICNIESKMDSHSVVIKSEQIAVLESMKYRVTKGSQLNNAL